jgi:gas vesicle protein
MAERGDGRSFLLGALLGSLLGALWALWNAPRSGAATRQAIRAAWQRQIGNLRRRVSGESLEEALAEGKATARQLNQR